jgi:hypothetical protein
MAKDEVVLVKAIITEDGRAVQIVTPFKELPDWAKTLVNPLWDHPNQCECIKCWEAFECGGR